MTIPTDTVREPAPIKDTVEAFVAELWRKSCEIRAARGEAPPLSALSTHTERP